MNKIVIDSGPFVALFDRSDQFHQRSLHFIQQLTSTAYTTTSVITEVAFLLDFSVHAQKDFFGWIAASGIRLVDLDAGEIAHVGELMYKYKDVPMDFTDGCVVSVCEKLETRWIATVDCDFEVYRFKGRQRFLNRFMDQ